MPYLSKRRSPCFPLALANPRSAEAWERAGWCARLGLVVLVEQSLGSESAFHAYLKSLPQKVQVPLLWPSQVRASLQGTEADEVRSSSQPNDLGVVVGSLQPADSTWLWGISGCLFLCQSILRARCHKIFVLVRSPGNSADLRWLHAPLYALFQSSF